MRGKTIHELQMGMAEELARTYDEWDIYAFAALTEDINPAHIDRDFAEKTIFRGKIAHGMLTASLISAVLGTRLPGPGCIYLKQDLEFLRPVRIGDTVTARVEVVELVAEKNLARLRTTCTNQKGEPLLNGTALVMPPKLTPAAARPADEEAPAPEPTPGHASPAIMSGAPIRKSGVLVGQRMTSNPVTISADATVAEARALLDQHRIRHLPVVEEGELRGLVTDRDIRDASMPSATRNPSRGTQTLLGLLKVRDVMTRELVTIDPDASIGQASKLLVAHKLGALPVVQGGRLLGIITVIDVLDALADIIGT